MYAKLRWKKADSILSVGLICICMDEHEWENGIVVQYVQFEVDWKR
jgi:hypothetical protein